MAIRAITNTLLIHADTLADVQALGSDNGIAAESIAWIEETRSWATPRTISATSTVWDMSPKNIPSGLPQEGLVLFVDVGSAQSFPDPGTGTSIYDVMQNAGTGAINGATVTNSHLNFDGTNDDISFVKSAALDDLFQDGGGATVMVWCRPETIGSAMCLTSTQGTSANDGWMLQLTSTGAVQFFHNWSTLNFFVPSVTVLPAGQWASCAFAGDANGGMVYVNGKSSTGTGVGGTGTANDDTGNDLYVGKQENGSLPFDGDIEVVMMWNRILSSDEIRQAHDVMRSRFLATQGMVLVDTLTVTSGAGATSLTFDGLNGNLDGTYFLTGRVSSASGISVELRPNGTTTNVGSVFDQGTTTDFSSTTGWLVLAWAIPEGAAEGTGFCNVWIYPEENKGGSTSTRSGRRMYSGVSTLVTNTTPTTGTTETHLSGGWWDDASTNIVSLDVVAATGTMEQGTSFSLYYLGDAG